MGFNSFDFANDVCTSLMGNLATLNSSNQTLNLWTDVTQDLNEAYTVGNGSDEEQDITAAIHAINNPGSGLNGMQAFLNDYGPLSLNADQIALLLTQLSQPGVWDKDVGPTQMSTIQTWSNVLSATQQRDTSTGDTQSKSQASFIQQSTSAQQSVADLGNSVIGILGSASSMLMQGFL